MIFELVTFWPLAALESEVMALALSSVPVAAVPDSLLRQKFDADTDSESTTPTTQGGEFETDSETSEFVEEIAVDPSLWARFRCGLEARNPTSRSEYSTNQVHPAIFYPKV